MKRLKNKQTKTGLFRENITQDCRCLRHLVVLQDVDTWNVNIETCVLLLTVFDLITFAVDCVKSGTLVLGFD